MVAKKEHRMSLGELFLKSKMADDNSAGKCDKDEKRAEKDAEKSGVHLMKKMLKRRVPNSTTSRSSAAAAPADPVSAEKKTHKILQMFHRKVHPESTLPAKKPSKSHKTEIKSNGLNDGGCNNGDHTLPDEYIMIFPQRTISKERIRRYKSQSNPPQFALSGSDSNGNREYWIKTDADCKYK
uniref:Uncharacterized protein n=1 Tax=Nelumbo nucifera TaxID=4432 RepID=A0A822YSY3_NELNU|nr:TPA_asm: hypothetical protein HUJ06_004835 [Nelumbo nucifera]